MVESKLITNDSQKLNTDDELFKKRSVSTMKEKRSSRINKATEFKM
jgi:hypothetical protein